MAFQLPLNGSEIRELFDMADLVAVGTGQKVVTLTEARIAARRLLVNAQGETINPEIASVNYIVTKADGEVVLMTFSRDKAPATIWKFGKV